MTEPKRETGQWVKAQFADLDDRYQEMIRFAVEQAVKRAEAAERSATEAQEEAARAMRSNRWLMAGCALFVLLSFALVMDRSFNFSGAGVSAGVGTEASP